MKKKHVSLILTCLGSAGVIATAIITGRATIKAMHILEEAEESHELTKMEKFKIIAPTYTPATILGVSTVACIFGANILNQKYQASLMSAYALVNSSYNDYKRKLKELYGEDAHNKIVDELAIEKADEIYICADSCIESSSLTIDGENAERRLFYDGYSKRYFEASVEQVLNAEYHLNRNYILRGSACINEFYEFLGIAPMSGGEELGWDICSEIFWIDFNHHKFTTKDGLECCYISMPFEPGEDWLKY